MLHEGQRVRILKKIEQPPVPDIPSTPGMPGLLGTTGYLVADVGDEGWTVGGVGQGAILVYFYKTDRKATVPIEDLEAVD